MRLFQSMHEMVQFLSLMVELNVVKALTQKYAQKHYAHVSIMKNFCLLLFISWSQVAQVAAHTLGIDLSLVTVKPTNNLTSPNNYVTGGSLASEVNAYVRYFLLFIVPSNML